MSYSSTHPGSRLLVTTLLLAVTVAACGDDIDGNDAGRTVPVADRGGDTANDAGSGDGVTDVAADRLVVPDGSPPPSDSRVDALPADGSSDSVPDSSHPDGIPPDGTADGPGADSATPDTTVDLPPPPPDTGPSPDVGPMPPAVTPRSLAGPSHETTPGQPCSGPLTSGPAVLCVDHGNTSGLEQGTAACPYRTIGAAVSAASDGDTLQIASGTYQENVEVVGKALSLLGGFVGGGSFDARKPAANVTTIDGAASGPSLALVDAGSSTVDGLRIVNGSGYPWSQQFGLYQGGGVYVENGAPLIAHNLIENNDTVLGDPARDETTGGGIHLYDADSEVVGNLVRANVAGRGGGISVAGGAALLEGNDVLDNVAVGDHGGGIYAAAPSLAIVDNVVSGNVVGSALIGGFGGGILVFDPSTVAELRGNVVWLNRAPLAGSGVFLDDGAVVTLSNELIFGNQCPADGGAGVYVDGLGNTATQVTIVNSTVAQHTCPGSSAVLVEAPAAVVIENSILWGNGGDDLEISGSAAVVTVRYSIVEEAVPGATNLSVDPLFVAPQQCDFRLRSARGRWNAASGTWVADAVTSPGIDAADPAATIGQEPSPNGGRRNLGAYGATTQASLTP